MTAYLALEKTAARLHRLSHLGAIAGWDRAVMMPEGGGESRAEALAELSVLVAEILKSREFADNLERAEEGATLLSDWQRANLRELRRMWLRANAVTLDLIEAKSLAGSRCEQAWRSLRAANNWTEFKPLLEEVLNLTRQEAQQRAAATGLDPYDALMDQYEPGLRQSALDPLFARLMEFLPSFIAEVVDAQKRQAFEVPKGPFPIEQQRALGLELMSAVGFDFAHGRLDVSHHPFCGGVPRDVRLTTRYQVDDFTESLMGVLHETGHARYEQGLPGEWLSQPVGEARGMGIHESQSLLFEMQIGRGREFLSFAAPIMKKHLGRPDHPVSAWTPENLFRLYTQVQPGYIRVNADEVTYPAHVILRYEIERDLISGALEVDGIPDVWDEKMRAYLGLSTEGNFRDGCMQDIHWTDGAFGYFPTYTLGALNAAQIFAALKRELPSWREDLSAGRFAAISGWLQRKVWGQGSFDLTDDLLKQATGEALNPDHFIRHLQTRYRDQ